MKLTTATIAAGVGAVLCTGAAVAQYNPGYPPPNEQGPGGPQNQVRHGKRAQINEAVRSGQISKSEGKQLKRQLKAEKAQRRALKQARRGQRGYQPANYSSPPSPQQYPQQ
jgi:hypothetical protein